MRPPLYLNLLPKVQSVLTFIVLCLGLVATASTALADDATASNSPKWIYPVIAGYGGVHPRTDVAVRPDPREDYKIFVDVMTNDATDKGEYHSLMRLARLVNLMAYAGVPAKQVHIVALLDGETGYASLTDAAFQAKFKKANANAPILHALKKAGVEIMICSQALAQLGVPDADIDKSVTITLSALTDAVVYGHKGYSYMQL